MDKPILIVMCGLAGSGKSIMAKNISSLLDDVEIVSSDELRKELFGNKEYQGDKDKLFKEYNNRILTALGSKGVVIADKTNISIRSRKSLLDAVKSLDIYRFCIVCNTPFEECLKNNATRKRKIPEATIRKQLYGFQVPFYEEGWDAIELVNGPKEELEFFRMLGFNQKNPHHSQNLLEHSMSVAEAFIKKYPDMGQAAIFHDIGKIYTQKIGEDGIAHYYGHENVGAYKILTGCHGNNKKILDISFLANYHMMPFDWNTKKAQDKWRKTFGDEKYKMLLYFNKCDKVRPKKNGEVLLEGEKLNTNKETNK